MVGWHHYFDGDQLRQTPGDSEGQGSPWRHKESDTTQRLNSNHRLITDTGSNCRQRQPVLKPRGTQLIALVPHADLQARRTVVFSPTPPSLSTPWSSPGCQKRFASSDLVPFQSTLPCEQRGPFTGPSEHPLDISPQSQVKVGAHLGHLPSWTPEMLSG